MTLDRWSVWLAGLDPVVGSEQGKTRPVLVMSDTRLNQILPVVNVIPITSRKRNRRSYPNEGLLLLVLPASMSSRWSFVIKFAEVHDDRRSVHGRRHYAPLHGRF